MAACVGGIGFSFYRGALFAAYCFAYLPVFLIIIGVFGSLVKNATSHKIDTVKGLGGVVAETISAIKVVASFNGE